MTEDLKARITRERGHWHPRDEALLRLDPDFLKAYFRMNHAPAVSDVLPRKVRELIYLIINASIDHMYEPGLRRHIEYAVKHGATVDEVLEVLQIAVSAGQFTPGIGLLMLDEEIRQIEGYDGSQEALDTELECLKSDFITVQGYWPEWGDSLLRHAPDYAHGLLNVLATPARRNRLAPSVRELIYLGLYASPATLNQPAMRLHMRRALQFGATKQEIVAVLQLSSALCMHAMNGGLPILMEQQPEG